MKWSGKFDGAFSGFAVNGGLLAAQGQRAQILASKTVADNDFAQNQLA
jgi:F0F1-type ATP synthase epsilon subunit